MAVNSKFLAPKPLRARLVQLADAYNQLRAVVAEVDSLDAQVANDDRAVDAHRRPLRWAAKWKISS